MQARLSWATAPLGKQRRRLRRACAAERRGVKLRGGGSPGEPRRRASGRRRAAVSCLGHVPHCARFPRARGAVEALRPVTLPKPLLRRGSKKALKTYKLGL